MDMEKEIDKLKERMIGLEMRKHINWREYLTALGFGFFLGFTTNLIYILYLR